MLTIPAKRHPAHLEAAPLKIARPIAAVLAALALAGCPREADPPPGDLPVLPH